MKNTYIARKKKKGQKKKEESQFKENTELSLKYKNIKIKEIHADVKTAWFKSKQTTSSTRLASKCQVFSFEQN